MPDPIAATSAAVSADVSAVSAVASADVASAKSTVTADVAKVITAFSISGWKAWAIVAGLFALGVVIGRVL